MNNWLRTLVEIRWVRPWRQVAIFLIAIVLIVSRRPDALFRAQFWAEDGTIFYSDAYNFGWFHSEFHTYAGYFHLIPRLAAAISLLVPLLRAPLVLNIIAIAAYALPVNLLLSSRSKTWGSLGFRALLAASYLALPFIPEVLAMFADVQLVLVISALILVVGAAPRNTTERICDAGFLLACGLTGPFCFFLLPIAAIVAYTRRGRWEWVPVCIFSLCSFIQAWALLFLNAGVRSAFLGATPHFFLRILAENVFLSAILGVVLFTIVPASHAFLFELSVAGIGSILSAVILLRARLETKMFCLLATMAFAASMISPGFITRPEVPGWQLLAQAYGIRYWFLPSLAFIWLLIDATQGQSKVLKSVSAPLLFMYIVFAALQWRQPALRDMHFADEVARFRSAPNGAIVIIPENPEGRTVRLVKHASEGVAH